MGNFIPDGYDEWAGIDPVPGVHDGLEFRYRPFRGDEAAAAYRRVYRNPAESTDRLLKILCGQPDGRMIEWNQPETLSRKVLKTMRPALFERLALIVLAQSAPDYRLEKNGDGKLERVKPRTDDDDDADAGN